MTVPVPGQAIRIDGVPNLRDLCGWAAPGGRVARDRVFRPAEFFGLRGDAAKAFAALGLPCKPTVDTFASIGGDPQLLEPAIGVRREYLDAARDEMAGGHKTIEGYFLDGLGVGPAIVDRLRSALVETA
ncbi:tyrosine-protein phosphatase [Streptomyces sp. NPDC048577]|uniref:tyrosine-protein phosphatase n=1 Tax=Streptomyces sp. NPDC048577 TaxID=3157209 RepID=UPI003433C025